MKKIIIALFVSFYSLMAQAAVGVAVGYHTWAKDGLPDISPGEQISVFVCRGKMSGADAAECALNKCMKQFKIPPKTKADSHDLVGGACKVDGWSERKGYSIIVLGPKGNNNFIMSKALGDSTREEAMKFVKSNKFPVRKENIVLDIYDDGNWYFPFTKKAERNFCFLFYIFIVFR